MLSSEFVFLFLVAGGSAIAVGIVRQLAVAHGVIDHPTSRGSHDVPTPRGGGLGAIIAIVIALGTLGVRASEPAILVSIVACVAVAIVGWFDDRSGLSVRSRLVVHVTSGLAVGLLWVSGVGPTPVHLALVVWWVFWTVSSINLVNFMDGINGLVTLQIAIFAASLMLLGWETNASSWYAGTVAAACLGFLPWNFPRARIFLGDIGSGALGFLVPVLAVLAMRDGETDVIRAHLPLLPLFGDATITIIRRLRRGERLTEPHRTHLYQRLANVGMGHTRVTLIYAAASLCGAVVAHSARPSFDWLLIAMYVVGVFLLGLLLERRLRTGSELT